MEICVFKKKCLLQVLFIGTLFTSIPVQVKETVGKVADVEIRNVIVSAEAETSADAVLRDLLMSLADSSRLLIQRVVQVQQDVLPVNNEAFNHTLSEIYRLSDLIVLLGVLIPDLREIEPAMKKLALIARCLKLTPEKRAKALFQGKPICAELGCMDTTACVVAYLKNLHTVLKPILRFSLIGVSHKGKIHDGILLSALEVAGLPIKDQVRDVADVVRDIVSVIEDLGRTVVKTSDQLISVKDSLAKMDLKDGKVKPSVRSGVRRMITFSDLKQKAESIGNVALKLKSFLPRPELSDVYQAAYHVTDMIVNIANLISYADIVAKEHTLFKDRLSCLKGSLDNGLCTTIGCSSKKECVAEIVATSGKVLLPIIHNILGRATLKDGKPAVSAGLLLNITLLIEIVLDRTRKAMELILDRRAAPDQAFVNLEKAVTMLHDFNKEAIKYAYYLDQALSVLPMVGVMLDPAMLVTSDFTDEQKKDLEKHTVVALPEDFNLDFSDDPFEE